MDKRVKTADTSGDTNAPKLGSNAPYAETPMDPLPITEPTIQPVAALWPSFPPAQGVGQSGWMNVSVLKR